MSEKVRFSRPGDPDNFEAAKAAADVRMLMRRIAWEFVAGFETEAEARAALALLAMPVQGSA